MGIGSSKIPDKDRTEDVEVIQKRQQQANDEKSRDTHHAEVPVEETNHYRSTGMYIL